MKTCIACGMPMEKSDDFAMGDCNKDYCHYCAREDGSMKSLEECIETSIPWAMEEYKITEDEARVQGIEHYKTQPAFKNK